MTPRIVLAFGTRPEATKMAPVYRALQRRGDLQALILSTGQQREMLDSAMSVFGLRADLDLEVMTDRQTLAGLTGKIVPQAGEKLRELGADFVCVKRQSLPDTLDTGLPLGFHAFMFFKEGVQIGQHSS